MTSRTATSVDVEAVPGPSDTPPHAFRADVQPATGLRPTSFASSGATDSITIPRK
jgi:hypothetical protein